MNRTLLGLTAVCAGWALAGRAQDDIRRDATVRAVEMVMPSVVNIATKSVVPVQNELERVQRQFLGQRLFDEYLSAGSGVIIDENGYLLTNEHVVRDAEQIAVRFATATNDYEATVVARDPRIDVALLQLKCRPGEKFHAIKLAREDDLLLGETVIALGNPLGLGGSVTRGILSAKSRVALQEGQVEEPVNLLQTDAPINHGNSGGPLVDLRGELIGINAQVINRDRLTGEPVQGISFAIPIRLLEEADIFPTEFVKSYWFGARVKVGAYPLVVTSVQPESPAGRAGLKVGDVVIDVNGKPPKTFIDFKNLVAANAPDEFSITIRREDVVSEIRVRMVPVDSVFNAAMVRDKLGVTLEKSPNGYVIADVESNSPAGNRGLKPGMIVRGIDMQTTPEDITGIAQRLYEKKKGESVMLNLLVVQQVGNVNVIQRPDVELQLR